jgi:transcriptional regulator with XRE-family HTH domain
MGPMSKRITENQRRAAAFVRHAAVAQKLGRGEIATAAGVDPGTVGDFLNGKRWPTLSNREAICAAVGVSADMVQAIADGVSGDTPLPGGFGDDPSGAGVTVSSSVAQEERGELSGQRIVRVHIAALGVDVQTTLGDDEDRATVIAEIMESVGLEGTGIERDRADTGGLPT